MIENPERWATFIGGLQKRRHVREAILLRLVIAGYPLGKATKLRLCDVADVGPSYFSNLLVKTLHAVKVVASPFDRYCSKRDFGTLGTLIESYVMANAGLFRDDKDVLVLDRPLFPSRKGGQAITARSAQRRLEELRSDSDFSYAKAKVLRRKLLAAKSKHDEEEHTTIDALDYVAPLCRWLFPRDMVEREDALQESALALLENPGHSEKRKIAAAGARAYERDVTQYKRNCVTGRLGDWSIVESMEVPPDYTATVRIDDADFRARLSYALAALPIRHRRIIRLRYGLGRESPLSFAEMAKRVHISPERVRQLVYEALTWMRRHMDL